MASSLHEHKAAAEAEAAAYEAAVGSFPDGWGEEEEAVEEAAEEEYFGEEDGEGRLEEYTMVGPGLTPTLALALTLTLALALTLALTLAPALALTLIPTLTLTRSSRTGPRRQERARGTG